MVYALFLSAWAACPAPASTVDLERRLVKAEQAFSDIDANNRALAETAFAAARAIEPDFVLPSAVATDTVNEIYRALPPGRGAVQPLPRPREGAVRLDGTQARERPLERPTVFQRTGARGEVIESVYLIPGMPTPAYDVMDI